MTSSFSTRAKNVGAQLSMRHNGQKITLRTESSSVVVRAAVEIQGPGDRDSGTVQVNGLIRILTADFSKKVEPLGLVVTATINGQEWDIYERLEAQEGLIPFKIRRRFEESEYTNRYDISGNQAQWG